MFWYGAVVLPETSHVCMATDSANSMLPAAHYT